MDFSKVKISLTVCFSASYLSLVSEFLFADSFSGHKVLILNDFIIWASRQYLRKKLLLFLFYVGGNRGPEMKQFLD